MAALKDNADSSPIEVFYSYSHKDEKLRQRLENHLTILKNEGLISGWKDADITAGAEWDDEIKKHLNAAKVILLLISEDFLASKYCYDVEMKRAMERHERGEARVIPIILHEVDWSRAPFGKLKALPKDGKAVSSWRNRAQAFKNVALGIRNAIEELRNASAATPIPGVPGDSLPPIWNVPHRRNNNFTGREGLLKELHDALNSGKPAALTQALHGLGGVGKTQTAVEYANRHAKDYSLVWWIRSETSEKLAADYALLAEQLNLKEKTEREQKIIVQAVRNALARRAEWLLIFDNAERPDDIRDYLPQGSGGHVLVTSVNPAFGSVAHPLRVKAMEPDEAVEFLLKRTPQTDKKAAQDLAKELGYLPLALEHAAAYIEKTGATFPGYLKLFKERQKDVLARAERPASYHATVATTWELSFVEVEKQSKAAAQVMNLCAFLAPDDIPHDMLQGGAKYLPKPLSAAVADEFQWNEAVGALRRYSLTEVNESAVAVHRLVQAVARERLGETEWKQWAEAAVEVVNAAFPFDSDDYRTWKQCARLLPHALIAADYSEKRQLAQDSTARLLNQLGMYLRGRSELIAARSALERALKIGEATCGPDHPTVAILINNLGGVLQVLGDLAGARTHYERALKMAETAHGAGHPTVATIVNNLGEVLRALGDLAGARKHFERALKIDEAAYGPDHPDVTRDVNNLGLVLQALGDPAGARKHFERALKIDEAAYGLDHPEVATDVSNLGVALKDLGDLAGARKNFERALKIDEAAYGPDHPDVARDVNNLGEVLRALGDLAGARKNVERALKIAEATYGPDHPKVATMVNNLGSVLQALGDLPGARKNVERALKIAEAAYGPDHPDVARDVNNLGLVLKNLGDFARARKHYERALKIFEQALGKDHPSTQTVRRNLEGLGE
jgi:tetratricopeptide (TPR) repeat protein